MSAMENSPPHAPCEPAAAVPAAPPDAHDIAVFCPTNAALSLLSERWTLHIVRALLEGRKRFNEIARALGISPATLRERLRALEDEDVVARTVVSAMPPNVEYALTKKGMALNGIFELLAQWGRDWMHPKGADLLDNPPLPAADAPLPAPR